ncbi:MAG: LamG-like jellyroll fold domain-containing protein, partial [Candidatus Kariarchaeaceae archaeon]
MRTFKYGITIKIPFSYLPVFGSMLNFRIIFLIFVISLSYFSFQNRISDFQSLSLNSDSFSEEEPKLINKLSVKSSQQTNLSFNGHDYLLIPLVVDWQTAREDCESRNMHLVTITSAEEQDFISSMVLPSEIWIGATDEISEGVWDYWITGEKLIYNNWQGSEPNDYAPGEDYAYMTFDGSWNDAGPPGHGEILVNYVCESYGVDFLALFDGLVLNLPMDEGTGNTLYDISGNNYDAEIVNADWTLGILGNGLEFDGSSSFAQIAPPFVLGTQEITISAWVNYYSFASDGWNRAIICQDDMFGTYTGSRVFQLSTWTNTVTLHRFGDWDLVSEGLLTNQFYLITATFNGSHHRLYRNGILNDQDRGSFSTDDNVPIEIGRKNPREDFYFHGIIDEVSIYNRSLTADEILLLYNFPNLDFNNYRVEDPNGDLDSDGMPNLWELQHGLNYTLNDAQKDLDGDTMPNFWEYQMGLRPNFNDTLGDLDGDGIANIFEYQLGLLANVIDVIDDYDGDGMPNIWEYQMGLIPIVNDSQDDLDSDGMPNIWEYQMGLRPNFNDTLGDLDGDGLANIFEYQLGLLA